MGKGSKIPKSSTKSSVSAASSAKPQLVKKTKKFPLMGLMQLEGKAIADITKEYGAAYRDAYKQVMTTRNSLLAKKVAPAIVALQKKGHMVEEAFWVRVFKNITVFPVVRLAMSVEDERVLSYCSNVAMDLLPPASENSTSAVGGVKLTFTFDVAENPYFSNKELSTVFFLENGTFLRSTLDLGVLVGVQSTPIDWLKKPENSTPLVDILLPNCKAMPIATLEQRRETIANDDPQSRLAARKYAPQSDRAPGPRTEPAPEELIELYKRLQTDESMSENDMYLLEPVRQVLQIMLSNFLDTLYMDLYPAPEDDGMDEEAMELGDDDDEEDSFEEDDEESDEEPTDKKAAAGKKPLPKPAPECKQQ